MAGLSDYLEVELLKFIIGTNGALGTSLTRFMALGTAATDVGITEVANSNAYARLNISGLFGTPSAGSVNNTSALTWPQATGSWGTVTHVAIFDSGTHGAGTCLWIGALAASQAIANTNVFEIATGQGTINAD